jgi:MoaA/NifB/PqqE/SkfB family radical SAM enzyme
MTIEKMQITELKHSDINDPFMGLTAIEVNPTELCNRTCSFCPRVDPEVYPNRNLHMTEETIMNLINDLKKNNYKARIVFSGFGEPSLNKNILKLISIARTATEDVQMYTNGDKILDDSWYSLDEFIDAGLTSIFLDVYDSYEQHKRWEKKIEPFKNRIPIHLSAKYNFKISLFTNRSGTVKTEGIRQGAVDKPCFIPHTKAFIDWDGTLLLCCNDWSRAAGGFGNINDTPLSTLWMSNELSSIRKKLMYGSRINAGSPCNVCDATGNQKAKKWVLDTWGVKLNEKNR